MASYTVERSNPLNVVSTITILSNVFANVEEIDAVLHYAPNCNSDIISYNVDLTSGTDILTYTINGKTDWVFKVNQSHPLFNSILNVTNFYFTLTNKTSGNIEYLNFYIKPSTVSLENIAISSTVLNGETIGGQGAITNSGVCELWSDYNYAVFLTDLNRVYYNNRTVELEDSTENELAEKLNIALSEGGGRIDITTQNISGDTLTINHRGLYIKTVGKDDSGNYVSQNYNKINIIGANNSVVFDTWISNNEEKTTYYFYNSSPLFTNCKFKNCEFVFIGSSSALFNNSKFENCQFKYGVENDSFAYIMRFSKCNFINCNIGSDELDIINAAYFYQSGFTNTSVSNIDKLQLHTCGIYKTNSDKYCGFEYINETHIENVTFSSSQGLDDNSIEINSHIINIEKSFSNNHCNVIFKTDELSNASIKCFNCAFNSLDVINYSELATLVLSNFTCLSPIGLYEKEFNIASLIQSTVLGSSAYSGNEFVTIINSLVLNVTDDKELLGKTEAIYGTDQGGEFSAESDLVCPENSFIYYIPENGYYALTFSKEVYPYGHLNGMIKCLHYNPEVTGVGQYEIVSAYTNYLQYVSGYIQSKDIFGNVRDETAPKAGCEEYGTDSKYGHKIELNYSATHSGIVNFETALNAYQSPIVEDEIISDLYSPIFSWYKGEEKQLLIINSDNKSKLVYPIHLEDDGKEIICECDYGNDILSTSITLRIAEVPVLVYNETKYTTWTNGEFKAIATIKSETLNENDFALMTSNWYVQPEIGAAALFSNSYIYQNPETGNTETALVISNVEKVHETSYFCELSYLPEGFESPRIIGGVDKNGKFALVNIIVKYNVIIDDSLTTTGEISLKIDDILTLSGNILQGDSPWFEWQKSKDQYSDVWESVYNPTQNLLDYKTRLKVIDKEGTYYRFHAFNYIDDDHPELGIATEAFSQPYAFIKTLPKTITGNEISSNVVLFKIPLEHLSNIQSTYDVGTNYRRFESLDNIDYTKESDNLNYYPTLHRREDSELWRFNGTTGNYDKSYLQYTFPSDVDIDKYNLKFGVATDKLSIVDSEKFGGKLYILELEHLNDNVDFKINKPKIVLDMYDAYNRVPLLNDNIEWESLGDSVYARNNFIAVADPNARIAATNKMTEFDTFTNPRLYANGNKVVWDIRIREPYAGIPYMQLLEKDNSIAIADISYLPDQLKIRVSFDTDVYYLAENTFKLNIVGKKYSTLNNYTAQYSEFNPDLQVDENNIATWKIDIPDIFTEQPLVQLTDSEGGTVSMSDIIYNEAENSYSIKLYSIDTIFKESLKVTLIGKDKEYIGDDTLIAKKYKNDILYSFDGIVHWVIKYDTRFKTIPLIQLYGVDENENLMEHITNIKFDETNTSVDISFDLNYSIPRESLVANIIGEKYDPSMDEYETVRDNVGRVLLFKYDGNAGIIELVKIIKSPTETKEGYFGQVVEFDDHNNIIISAPGEVYDNYVGYYESGHEIFPAIKSDTNLKFETRGKVYVYSLDELTATGVFEYVDPKQTLTNQTMFKTIDYNNGSWGDLKKLYRTQSLYTVKDTATNGQKVSEGFSDMESYLEYYAFNYEYDFMYKRYFPEPYTVNDFYNGDSRSEYFTIDYRQLYYTSNMDERYGTAISYNNETLLIGAPYYQNNKGMIETWHYDNTLKRYMFGAGLKNPYVNNELLFGINVEMGKEYVLATYRQTVAKQAVAVIQYSDSHVLINNSISITNGSSLKSKGYGNSLDSYDYTFAIADPNNGKIYRYNYYPNTEDGKYTKLIQTINLQNFGIITNDTNNIVITRDKILASYNSFGSATDAIVDSNGNRLISTGEGAVMQFTLSGGEYKA